MSRNPGRTVFIVMFDWRLGIHLSVLFDPLLNFPLVTNWLLGNLDEKVSERVLYEILIQAGHVVDLYIPCDKENNRPKGYAFAEYETEEIAQYAVKLFSGLVRINDKLLKFMIAGHDKPSSNGNNPVMPKLNPIALPKQNQFVLCTDMPVSHTPAYPVVNGKFAGYDRPSSNGNNPVMPKLNPIPLPKQSLFVHRSDMPVSHTPAYPAVNGYGVSPNLHSYGVHPQALSGGPVHRHGEFSNGMYDYSRHAFGSALNAAFRGPVPNAYDYSRHAFGSALNAAFRGPVPNAFAHGAANQPIMYPTY